MFDYWKSAPRRAKRIMTISLFFILSVIVTIAGILTPLTTDEVDLIGSEQEQTQESITTLPEMQQVSFIFGNNFIICLAGFVPVVGVIFECVVLYNTGVVISAYSTYIPDVQMRPLVIFLLLFLFPFTWLEFLSYSTAMAGSFWLTWQLIERQGRRELRNACVLISLCACMLLLGAIIEAGLI